MATPCARPEPSPFHSPIASASPAFILRPDLTFAGTFDCDHNHNLGLALVLVLDPDSGLVLGVPTPATLPLGLPMAALSRSTPTMTSIQTSPVPSHSPAASAPLVPVSLSLFTSRSPISHFSRVRSSAPALAYTCLFVLLGSPPAPAYPLPHPALQVPEARRVHGWATTTPTPL
ncbi:hypothetical protein FS749_012491 [Ceratobasidium sp. UAMH 11750]|nr:hypothetical protein FS749_012491 [Ceratobasidium sp. UAMH 11750]